MMHFSFIDNEKKNIISTEIYLKNGKKMKQKVKIKLTSK
jgi:sRNA-binding regulator protein Hfq